MGATIQCFQFPGIPPKGELLAELGFTGADFMFPISRDPPEGGTDWMLNNLTWEAIPFPISRDPPEGGTFIRLAQTIGYEPCFQFPGIPPKGERPVLEPDPNGLTIVSNFQGSPRRGNSPGVGESHSGGLFPISRDPPEGGTFSN